MLIYKLPGAKEVSDRVWREAVADHLLHVHGGKEGRSNRPSSPALLLAMAHGEAHMYGEFADGLEHTHVKEENSDN